MEYMGCKNARYITDRKGNSFNQTCERCLTCRLRKHNATIGECLAEAQTSVYVWFLTLTYADKKNGNLSVAPDGAKRPDKGHIDVMLKSLRDAGHRVSKAYVNEYGGKDGRNHWHVLLFFKASVDAEQEWKRRYLQGKPVENIWMCGKALPESYAPKFALLPLPRDQFTAALNDPETLLCEGPKFRRTGQGYRNTWKYWAHGKVTCELLWGPFQSDPMALNRGVSYVVKYMSVDPWKGDKKYKHMSFDELPEVVKQTTKYGPDVIDNKGRKTPQLGNRYLKDCIAGLLQKYECDDDIPLDEQIYKTIVNSKNQPCLGRVYFEAVAGRHAALGPDHMQRQFAIAGVVKKMTEKQIEAAVSRGETRQDLRGEKPRKFWMKEAAWVWYAEAYIQQRISMGGIEANDRDHRLANILDRKALAKERASAPLGFHLWRKANGPCFTRKAKKIGYRRDWPLCGLSIQILENGRSCDRKSGSTHAMTGRSKDGK